MHALFDAKNVPMNARQRCEYTEGEETNPFEEISFRPGGGRGRPPKGLEAVTFTFEDADKLRMFLKSDKCKMYKTIKARLKDDCHIYWAKIEEIGKERILVIPGFAPICSITYKMKVRYA